MAGSDEVIENLRRWQQAKLDETADTIDNDIIPLLESYAKANRPWTDRTGNARRGLKGTSMVSASEIRIQLWHTVYYGVYLEQGFEGRFSILRPTVRRFKGTVISRLRQVWRS